MPPKLTETQGRDYDVVVIGAGINGASAARELASAGYSILLVDKQDFASGASSRSSRILHCGLRYFETPNPVRTFAFHPLRLSGAVHMARAGMEARAELVALAPERCKPFTMCFPVYPESPVRNWHLDLGLRILRRLGPLEPPLAYRRLTRDFEDHLPFASHLRDRGRLQSIATYREYIMDWPDRLCVDAALDAEENGAEIRLFCEAKIVRRQESGWRIELKDHDSGEPVEIGAAVVLNMTGTWIDEVNAGAMTGGAAPRLIRGTKGAHIAVRLPDSYRGYGITTINRSGMPFYCLPSHDDCFYFGPTETPFDGDAADVAATDEDIDFLLGEANYILPGLELARRHVEFTWAGVRPLTFDVQQPMGRRTREIHDLAGAGKPGIFAMTAGPVMTHVSAGREMRKVVEKYLSPARSATGRQISAIQGRGVGFGISRPPVEGRRAAFRRAVSAEHARDLKGILYTRTGLAWRRHLDRGEVEEAASSVADLAGWSPERTTGEVDKFTRYQKTVFRTASDPVQSTETTSTMGDVQA
ncbi:FAD-dependent oxidoreductase [Mesorhizobium sp. WSM2239]|uniref:FAD-dependent oxidoreductase n=2 Tax=unclassified Mesorhizobium TaxID=325217 RepID=A0AAU8DHM1_9HYPH